MELRIHSEGRPGGREKSPDYSAFRTASASTSTAPQTSDEDEHVLILDLADSSKGKKSSNPGFVGFASMTSVISRFGAVRFVYAPPPALTPDGMKKLVNRRNERFTQAVNEYICRCFQLPFAVL